MIEKDGSAVVNKIYLNQNAASIQLKLFATATKC